MVSRALMALRSGEIDVFSGMLYLCWWWVVVEESIFAIWFARCLASALACHLIEHCQVWCSLVVKRVWWQQKMHWCFKSLEVVPSIVVGEAGVVLLMLICLLWHQRLRPQCLLPVGGLVGVWH